MKYNLDLWVGIHFGLEGIRARKVITDEMEGLKFRDFLEHPTVADDLERYIGIGTIDGKNQSSIPWLVEIESQRNVYMNGEIEIIFKLTAELGELFPDINISELIASSKYDDVIALVNCCYVGLEKNGFFVTDDCKDIIQRSIITYCTQE